MAIVDKPITNYDELPIIMKVSDVQRVLAIDKVSAYRLVNSEGFPSFRRGKRILILKEAFIKWLYSIFNFK